MELQDGKKKGQIYTAEQKNQNSLRATQRGRDN